MRKIIVLIGFAGLAVLGVVWIIRSNPPRTSGPSPAEMEDVNVLTARCAHVPQDQIDACTMKEYENLHHH